MDFSHPHWKLSISLTNDTEQSDMIASLSTWLTPMHSFHLYMYLLTLIQDGIFLVVSLSSPVALLSC